MKIVKRVSLYKGVQRTTQPYASSFKIDKIIYNRTNRPFKLTTQQQLFKYGFKNYPYSVKLIALSIFAGLFGMTFDAFSKQLLANEVQTVYSNKLKQKHISTILLSLRKAFFCFFNEMILANIFPFHEYFILRGLDNKNEEKIIRVQQYRYYQKNRDRKYDFMELGVLQKFPYPINERPAQMGQ